MTVFQGLKKTTNQVFNTVSPFHKLKILAIYHQNHKISLKTWVSSNKVFGKQQWWESSASEHGFKPQKRPSLLLSHPSTSSTSQCSGPPQPLHCPAEPFTLLPCLYWTTHPQPPCTSIQCSSITPERTSEGRPEGKHSSPSPCQHIPQECM